jgi:accessory colonization factor AcfC
VTVWVTSPNCPSSIERVSSSNVTPVGLGGTGTGVGSAVGWGVAAAVGLAAAGVMVIDGEAVGDTSGAGVAADVQPTTSRATTIVVERREIEGRIPMSSGRYVG